LVDYVFERLQFAASRPFVEWLSCPMADWFVLWMDVWRVSSLALFLTGCVTRVRRQNDTKKKVFGCKSDPL